MYVPTYYVKYIGTKIYIKFTEMGNGNFCSSSIYPYYIIYIAIMMPHFSVECIVKYFMYVIGYRYSASVKWK